MEHASPKTTSAPVVATPGAFDLDEELHSDRGSWRSGASASALAGLLVAWFALPHGLVPGESSPPSERKTDAGAGIAASEPESGDRIAPSLESSTPVGYRIAPLEAFPVSLRLTGTTMASEVREMTVQASGRVSLLALEGEALREGQAIARIADAQAEADLAEARASLARAERDHASAALLSAKGVAPEDRQVSAFAALEAARARLVRAKEAVDDLTLRATGPGVLERLDLEEGERVERGTSAGRILRLDPLEVSASVPQSRMGDISAGDAVTIEMADGRRASGRVHRISSEAHAATRTVPVVLRITPPGGGSSEIALEHDDAGEAPRRRGPAGEAPDTARTISLVGATALVSIEKVRRGILTSPSALVPMGGGRSPGVGVFLVEDDGEVLRARLVPAEVISHAADGFWIGGEALERSAAGGPGTDMETEMGAVRIVEMGQGRLLDGARVDARLLAAPGARRDAARGSLRESTRGARR